MLNTPHSTEIKFCRRNSIARFYSYEVPIVTAVTLCGLCLLSTSVTDHAHVHIHMWNRTNSLSSNKSITNVPWKAGLTQWLYVNQQCSSTRKISTKITTALASIIETVICSHFGRLCMHKEDCFSYTKFTQQRTLLPQNCTFKRMLTTNLVIVDVSLPDNFLQYKYKDICQSRPLRSRLNDSKGPSHSLEMKFVQLVKKFIAFYNNQISLPHSKKTS